MDGSALIFGNYRALELLGRGGFGQVYRGEHKFLTRRVVAIKVMRDAPLHTEKEQAEFLREAEILEQLKHRFILPVLDVGIQENEPYLVTEYAPNGSLRQRLNKLNGQLLPLAEALNILNQIAEALQFAHEHKVIHRDLKPDNILFNTQNEALLADFGIATLLHTASFHKTGIIGTPIYMAPEQFRGEIATESDQYALACMAYELLTGHPPFTAPDFIALGFKHVNEAPQPLLQLNPNLPAHINAAILKALAKERTKRYPNVQTFADTLLTSPASADLTQTRLAISPIQEAHETNLPPSVQPEAYSPLVSVPTLEAYSLLMSVPTLLDRRHYQEVLSICEHVVQLDPTLAAIVYRSKAFALHSLDRYQEELSVYKQAIQLDSRLANSYYSKEVTLCWLDFYEKALSVFDQAIRLDPGVATAYANKGIALNALDHYQEALNIFDLAIQLDPDLTAAYANKGIALNKLGRYQEALNSCDQAIQLDPNLIDTYYNKAFALYSLGRYQEALNTYDQAIQLDPDRPAAYYNKGIILDQLDREREARIAYDKARALGLGG